MPRHGQRLVEMPNAYRCAVVICRGLPSTFISHPASRFAFISLGPTQFDKVSWSFSEAIATIGHAEWIWPWALEVRRRYAENNDHIPIWWSFLVLSLQGYCQVPNRIIWVLPVAFTPLQYTKSPLHYFWGYCGPARLLSLMSGFASCSSCSAEIWVLALNWDAGRVLVGELKHALLVNKGPERIWSVACTDIQMPRIWAVTD